MARVLEIVNKFIKGSPRVVVSRVRGTKANLDVMNSPLMNYYLPPVLERLHVSFIYFL